MQPRASSASGRQERLFKDTVLFPIHLLPLPYLPTSMALACLGLCPGSYEQSHLPALGLTPAFLHLPEVPGEAVHPTPGCSRTGWCVGCQQGSRQLGTVLLLFSFLMVFPGPFGLSCSALCSSGPESSASNPGLHRWGIRVGGLSDARAGTC